MSDMFQRRHLNALADMVRNLGCLTEFDRRNVATEIAYALRANSPRVNVERFVAAATDTGRTDRGTHVPQVPRVCGNCRETATYTCNAGAFEPRYYCGSHAASGDCCTPLSN